MAHAGKTAIGQARLKIILAAAISLLVALVNAHWLADMNGLWRRPGFWFCVFGLKTAIECVASVYAIFYLLVAMRPRSMFSPGSAVEPWLASSSTMILLRRQLAGLWTIW